MKKLLLIGLVIAFATSPAMAQSGRIGLFADAAGTDCNVVDGPGAFSIYVLLIEHGGAAVTSFKLEPGAGFTASWQSDTDAIGTAFGTSVTGIQILLGGCFSAPTHVLTANFFGTGTSVDCTNINVGEDTNAPPPSPSITNCVGTRNAVPVDLIVVNPDGFCDCVVPTEETTWGRIKAIYK